MKKAFTLVELLIVVAIIGLLAAMVIANLGNARSKARDAIRKSDLRTIKVSLLDYFNDANAYKESATAVTITADTTGLSSDYIKTIPDDPSGDRHYLYAADITDFSIGAQLENSKDPDIVTDPANANSAILATSGMNLFVTD